MTGTGTKRSEEFHQSEKLLVDEANALLTECKRWAKNHGAIVEPSETSWADGQGVKISKAGAFVQIEGWTHQSLGKKNGEIGSYRGLVVRTHCDDTVHRLLRDPRDGWRVFKTAGIPMGASSSTGPLYDAIWERLSQIWGWFEALLNKAFGSSS
jgi:hypothetical protein